jgi:abortive infection bacteriophage resistance protein
MGYSKFKKLKEVTKTFGLNAETVDFWVSGIILSRAICKA